MHINKLFYRVWKARTHEVLVTQMPKDAKKCAAMITEHGEMVVLLAWSLYVNAEPHMWHLEPVIRVDEGSGRERSDEGAITKFPLSSFLSPKVVDGFITEAEDIYSDFLAGDTEKRNAENHPAFRALVDAQKIQRKYDSRAELEEEIHAQDRE
jgi:hypothetical protein